MTWYIGFKHNTDKVNIFRTEGKVTKQLYGRVYTNVGGPFNTESQAEKYAIKDGYKVKKDNPIKSSKEELRNTLKRKALNLYGKKVIELTSDELKTLLDSIHVQYSRLYSISKSEFNTLFKEIFRNEIRRLFKGNPPQKVTEIYGNITAIEATKGTNSLWPKEKFRHDFKRGGKIYGLDDGSLLVKPNKNAQKLWKHFNY